MILITGAAGKTGLAILKAVLSAGEPVRVLVRRDFQAAELRELGAQEVVVGDMEEPALLQRAFDGVRAAYHICPNMNSDEVGIGQNAITAAREAELEHFVYHSVLHPQVQEMAHHWNKLLVEGLLFKSGLNYTILQPASYMQNISGYWSKMLATGEYGIPYSVDARFSMVDLDDVAQAAARVLREGARHYRATYELCGSQLLSSIEIAEMAGQAIHRQVQAVTMNRGVWEQSARENGMNDYARTTLLKMFEYYDRYGFAGNATVLGNLLGRAPTRFEEYLKRTTHLSPSN
ncbi:MAG: NAD-dependent epimerase/dehydratase family protein [Chloroflexi bacterium]|nr:MAG: NAD-dependent epimerase/dehydratase family protein [Chloroflexota bacterium]